MEAIKWDMIVLHLTGDMALNKVEWEKMIHVVVSKYLG